MSNVAIAITPNESAIFTTLRAFLLGILPAGTPVIQAQQNRAPEPQQGDFVIMTPLTSLRLATNIDTAVDAYFQGAISGTTLTVSEVAYGSLNVGSPVYGSGVAPGTSITALAGGTGGVGAYTINISQSAPLAPMAGGVNAILQKQEFHVQLDVHGPNSANNAKTIATLFRDEYAYNQFNPPVSGVAPLYADAPAQRPFINDQDQYEWRWVLELHMQINQTVTLGQQFFDVATLTLVEIDAAYPG